MKTGYATRFSAAAAALVLAAGCNPFSDGGARRAMSVAPEGPGAIFVLRSGDEIEVTGLLSLAVGDVVRTASSGARIQLEGERLAWVAADSRVRVAGTGAVEVMGGSILAETGRHMAVAVDDVTATTGDGIMRVDGFSASAGVAGYAGEVAVSAPGQERVILDPLFDVSVAAGQVLSPRPYRVDIDDGWDRLHLADVVELNEQLERYADAISGQLGRAEVTGSYFRSLGGRSAAQAMARYLESPAYSAPDLLIGYSIADLDDATPPPSSLQTAFRLRREGGQWGVVATIMGVRAGALVAGIEDVIVAAGRVASASSPASLSTGPADGAGAAPRGDGGRNGSGGGASGGAGNGSEPPSGDSPEGSGGPGGSGGENGGSDSQPVPEEDCDNLIDCVIGILQLDSGGLLP